MAMATPAAVPYGQVMGRMENGREYATQLQALLRDSSPEATRLLDQILHAMSRATDTAKAAATAAKEEASEVQIDGTAAAGGKRKAAAGGADNKRAAACRKRTHQSSVVTMNSKDLEDGGHVWRKYGQKEIQNSKFPKSYYRCTHKYDQGCLAQRQVQRSDDDPDLYTVTYIGVHTCRDPATLVVHAAAAGDELHHTGSRLNSFTVAAPYAQVMEDMKNGREYATQLQVLLRDSPEAGRLLDRILHAMSCTFDTDIHINLQGGSSSSISSSSGTIVSTAYTSSSSVSHASTTISMEATMHFVSLEIDEDINGCSVQICEEAEDEETKEEHIRSLVQEFFSAPSVNCSITVRDISVVERWLKELGVGWVLRLHNDGASAAAEEEEFDRDARTWIRALGHVAQTFWLMRPLFKFPDHDSVGLPNLCRSEEEHVDERPVLGRYHLVLFILETMSKILKFVDVLVACDPDMTEEFLFMDQVLAPPYNKLITLLGVQEALSKVSYKMITQINWFSIESQMADLLLKCKRKLGEKISSTIEKEIRAMLMEDGNDSSSSLNPQGSSDIHKVTRSVMMYIRLLRANYSSLDAAMPSIFARHTENEQPFYNIIMEMVHCLQEKLANISESFPDQGLRFLFLLNNSCFIQESLGLEQPLLPVDLNDQTEGYMSRYLQVSWALLLSYLSSPTPLCLGKKYSLLCKFESEFQKIYTTQKQWKVIDPGLRRRLRKVITDKIIPGYTEYIEDNKVTNPKFSPQELKAMLQDLFEG